MQYYIVWDCELTADNPREAAEEALNMITAGTAKIFEVYEDHKEGLVPVAIIDLSYGEEFTELPPDRIKPLR